MADKLMTAALPDDLGTVAGRSLGAMAKFLDLLDDEGLDSDRALKAARVTTVAYKPVGDAVRWMSAVNNRERLRLMAERHEARLAAASTAEDDES